VTLSSSNSLFRSALLAFSCVFASLSVAMPALAQTAKHPETQAALIVTTQTKPANGATQPLPAKGKERQFGFHEPDATDFEDHEGYVSLFDGKTLKGWTFDPKYWRVEDGAIIGESTKEKTVGNSYISYPAMEAKDFDLKLEIKVENGGGSGIQYRSKTGLPWRRQHPEDEKPNLDWMMTGPQADFWYPVFPLAAEWTGQFYAENSPLGILAWRGQVVESPAGKAPQQMGTIADRAPLGGYVKVNDWNQYTIMARGGTFIHILNGQLMAVYVDDNPQSSNNQPGIIGFELEGNPSKVSVRNVWIKKLN
jgi:hypothetical protein